MKGFLSRRPEVALAFVTFLWGSTFILTKDIVRGAPPLVYLSLRFGSAALVLLAIFPRALRSHGKVWRSGAILGFFQAAGLLLQVLGQVYTTASKAAFVTAISTALTPMVALAFYGDRPTRPQAAGVLFASLGLYLLTYPVGEASWNRGDLFTAVCALVYSYVIVETARRARGIHAGELTTLQTGFAALTFLVGLAVTQLLVAHLSLERLPEVIRLEARPLILDGKLILQLAYMSLVCTVGTFLGQTWAMGRMSATHAAVVFALEPVFATGLAIAVEGGAEWPGARGAVGAGLVLVGVAASELKWSRQR
jgi:drug/metabolite transporter (DMT)-like permease